MLIGYNDQYAWKDVPSAPCLCTLLTSVVAAIVPSCLCAL